MHLKHLVNIAMTICVTIVVLNILSYMVNSKGALYTLLLLAFPNSSVPYTAGASSRCHIIALLTLHEV